MYAKSPPTFAYRTTSYSGLPAASPGTAITGGFSNTPGTTVALIGTALTHDVEMLEVVVSSAAATALTATDTSMILDLLIDPAGGTTWDTSNILIEGLMAGSMSTQGGTTGSFFGRRWLFPIWIKSGATIAGRAQSIVASGAVVFEVLLNAYGGINRPENYWCGTKVDAIGLNRGTSSGVSVTPHATAAASIAMSAISFASFGSTTARRYGCLIPSCSGVGTGMSSGSMQFQVGIGGVTVGPDFFYHQTNGEISSDFREDKRIYVDVPEGTQLQARLRCATAGAAANQFIIHGVA